MLLVLEIVKYPSMAPCKMQKTDKVMLKLSKAHDDVCKSLFAAAGWISR